MRTAYEQHDNLYRQRRDDDRYRGWDSSSDFAKGAAVIAQVMAWPEVPTGGRLLELGCGAADHLVSLSDSYELCGIDLSPTAIEWAAENLQAAEVTADVRVGDVRSLPWPDGFFRVVRDGHLLHCIIGDDRPKVLSEAHRVLAPDGVLVIFTMCGDTGIPAGAGFDPVTRLCVRGDLATRYIGRPEDLLNELEVCGFEIQRWEVLTPPDEVQELVAVARPGI